MMKVLTVLCLASSFGCATTIGAELGKIRAHGEAIPTIDRATLASGPVNIDSLGSGKAPVFLTSWSAGRACFALFTEEFNDSWTTKEALAVIRDMRVLPMAKPALDEATEFAHYDDSGIASKVDVTEVLLADESFGKRRWRSDLGRFKRTRYRRYMVEACAPAPEVTADDRVIALWFPGPPRDLFAKIFLQSPFQFYERQLVVWNLSEGPPSAPVSQPPSPPSPPAPPAPPPVAESVGPSFSLPKTSFKVGETIAITFGTELVAPEGQQYWITLVRPTDPDTASGLWHYVAPRAAGDILMAPAPGEYEVRLHDVYPRHQTKVLQRARVTVK